MVCMTVQSITKVFKKARQTISHWANSHSKAPKSVKVCLISHWVEEKTDTKLIVGLPTVDGIDIRNFESK